MSRLGTTALGIPTTKVDVVGQVFLLLGILALIGMAGRLSTIASEPGTVQATNLP
jgi:hypothetical protein